MACVQVLRHLVVKEAPRAATQREIDRVNRAIERITTEGTKIAATMQASGVGGWWGWWGGVGAVGEGWLKVWRGDGRVGMGGRWVNYKSRDVMASSRTDAVGLVFNAVQ